MCANVTMQIAATATAAESLPGTIKLSGMTAAAGSMTHLRARTGAMPRLMSLPDNHPPARAPRSAVRKGTQVVRPIATMLNPRSSLRYFGSQNR